MKCAVQDLEGNHCPEKPTRQIDKGVWLCEKCYRNWRQHMYNERRYVLLEDKVML